MFERAAAIKYVLDLLIGSEELNNFPREFVDASVIWVKSWFLRPEDPETNAELEDPNRDIEGKKHIIEDKLEELEGNVQFQEELTERLEDLTERLAAFEQQRPRLNNVLLNAEIEVAGDAHIGDDGSSSDGNYDEKNVIKGGKIKTGGNFRLGDNNKPKE